MVNINISESNKHATQLICHLKRLIDSSCSLERNDHQIKSNYEMQLEGKIC